MNIQRLKVKAPKISTELAKMLILGNLISMSFNMHIKKLFSTPSLKPFKIIISSSRP